MYSTQNVPLSFQDMKEIFSFLISSRNNRGCVHRIAQDLGLQCLEPTRMDSDTRAECYRIYMIVQVQQRTTECSAYTLHHGQTTQTPLNAQCTALALTTGPCAAPSMDTVISVGIELPVRIKHSRSLIFALPMPY
jgi:hypothetical protein